MNIFLNIVREGDRPQDEVRRHFGDAISPRIFVLNGHSRQYSANTLTPFTIKSMPRGGARYSVDGRDHHVTENSALLINEGQTYDLEFHKGASSESFTIFYARELVREAWSRSESKGAPIPETPNLVFRPSSGFARKLAELRRAMPSLTLSATRLEEHLIEILEAAAEAAAEHRGQAKRIPARSAAVRASLLAKLDRARVLLQDDPIAPDLDELARESGLSKFHLVRLFRAAYGLPPMAYAKALRMARAAELLKKTKRPITEIALDLGYQQPAGFTKAFRGYAGASPAAYRARAN